MGNVAMSTFAPQQHKLSLKQGTVKFLNIRTPKKCAIITLKVEQDGFTKE